MQEIAEKFGAMFLNNVYLFDSLPVNEASDTGAAVYWRTDGIHFSRFGHTVLAKNLLSKLMPLGIYPKDMVDAEKIYCESTTH
jgi:lysophospholipase L1-like esterase